MNVALLNETNDPASHLQWLENELSLAEKEDRVVILAGHIAPGCYTCVNNWSERYTILYERYQHIIRLAVFGHDHRELFEVVRSTTSDKPIGVHYVSGSLGTYMQVNPSVRLFKMHALHHLPIESKVLEFNIDLANQGVFEFVEIESKPSTYSPIMSDLSPVSYDRLSESFLTNNTAVQLFHTLMWKHGPQSYQNCDKECVKALYCDSRFSVNQRKL
jgi:hypothetical protein